MCFHIGINFRIVLPVDTKDHWRMLMGATLNLQMYLERKDILTTLGVPHCKDTMYLFI